MGYSLKKINIHMKDIGYLINKMVMEQKYGMMGPHIKDILN